MYTVTDLWLASGYHTMTMSYNGVVMWSPANMLVFVLITGFINVIIKQPVIVDDKWHQQQNEYNQEVFPVILHLVMTK